MINKVKNTAPWTYVINHLYEEEVAVTFHKKELQKASQKVFRIEKVIKRKCDKFMLNRKDTIFV